MQFHDVDVDRVLQIKQAPEVLMTEPPGYTSPLGLKKFQKKGVAFLYTAKRAGLFDSCGTGKTHVVMALMCLLKSRGELGRCLYVLPAADILAKVEELGKFTNNLNFAAAVGKFPDRLRVYNSDYDVTLVSYEVARGRDAEFLRAMNFDTVILDESHVFRNATTKTADIILRITEKADRVVTLSATPIQMSLVDIWTQTRAWHHGIFGSEHSFKRRYVVEEEIEHKIRRHRFKKRQIVGYKNLALPLTAKVLTPSGWTTMGKLKVGSTVSTPAGGIALVEQVFDQGVQDVWQLVMSDGSVVESTLDHLWTVKSSARPYRGWETLPLHEIVRRVSEEGQGYRLPDITSWEPSTPSELPLDPYLLGLLLGDGSIRQTPELFVARGEEELLTYPTLPAGVRWGELRANGEGACHKVSLRRTVEFPETCRDCGVSLVYGSRKGSCTSTQHSGRGLCKRCYGRSYAHTGAPTRYETLAENSVTAALRELGVWGCKAWDKFIPPAVFNTTSADRRAVLQGLLDTDGWVSSDGTRVHFVSVSLPLTEGVVALVRSLGGVAYTREDVVDGKVRYKVVVRLSGELFRLKRKAVRLHGRTSPQGKTGRYVRGASFVRTEEVRCIKLSSTAGLFVTNDYTPTHNCEFQRIIDPFFLRRTIKDVEDELPELVVSKKWGYLLPAQKTVYEQLRKGTVTLLSQGKRHEAKQNIHSMQLLVNSTAALGVQEDISWKLDWLMEQLHKDASGMGGSMSEDKVVVFAQHKATIRVITQRLEREGIGYVTMTGDYSKEDRQRFKKQFWEDPHCQVLIGTTAIEVSANLHCARFLVAFDSLPNPQRVEQLVGRIRRTGSEHKTVVFVMLLTYDTFEEKLYTRLERRQATVDKVFVETSDIFDSLSDMELAQLFSD